MDLVSLFKNVAYAIGFIGFSMLFAICIPKLLSLLNEFECLFLNDFSYILP